MIEVIPYFPEHAWVLQQKGDFPCIGTNLLAYAKALEEPGMAFTGRNEKGEVIGCAGIKKLWEGVGTAWSMLSDEVKKHPFFLHRTVKRQLERIAVTHKLHRVELIILNNFEAGKAWAVALGFKSEGVREKYTPDKQNVEVFVRLF